MMMHSWRICSSALLINPLRPKRQTLDFALVHQELKRGGVTRQLLWDEYRATHPAGYGYTQLRCAL